MATLLQRARSALIFIAIGGLILPNVQAAEEQAPKLAAAAFFSRDIVTDAQLSPNGDFVAIIVAGSGRRELSIRNLKTGLGRIVAGFSDVEIDDYHWVNNERLVFSVGDDVADGDAQLWPGLFAVNRDGSELRTLVERGKVSFFSERRPPGQKVLPANTFFFDRDRSGASDDVFVVQPVASNIHDVKALNLMRVNTKTGHVETFNRPGDTIDWIIDETGVPRVNVTLHNGIETIYYLDRATEKWRELAEFNAYTEGGFQPKYIGPDGALYVTARNGGDTAAFYRFNLEKNAIDSEPLIAFKDFDFDERGSGAFYLNDRFVANSPAKKLLGVHYETDKAGTFWFDDDMKNIQKKIDGLLPKTANILSVSGGNSKYVLVSAHSDVQPGFYEIYDTESGKLTPIGARHQAVYPREMSHREMLHYPARDGLDIPVYLTLPLGGSGKDLPMVVLVHGGPYVRGGSWSWDPEVQFLASRGYAVLEPEYRGSTGFGFHHFQAGWKQWGLAMQDDIADGARWAIARGIANPKRICIAGASYGGYSALMGLANDPDIFRCGIDWVGVTDIDMMYESDWSSDISAEWQQFGMPLLIGDRGKDAERLKATSPVNIASRITQPVILAYGGADHRVPIAHGEKFRDAVLKYNKNVEWIEYVDEGHGWSLYKNQIDFWTRVEKFLDANIGKPQ